MKTKIAFLIGCAFFATGSIVPASGKTVIPVYDLEGTLTESGEATASHRLFGA